jgi:hypothetical protein
MLTTREASPHSTIICANGSIDDLFCEVVLVTQSFPRGNRLVEILPAGNRGLSMTNDGGMVEYSPLQRRSLSPVECRMLAMPATKGPLSRPAS